MVVLGDSRRYGGGVFVGVRGVLWLRVKMGEDEGERAVERASAGLWYGVADVSGVLFVRTVLVEFGDRRRKWRVDHRGGEE